MPDEQHLKLWHETQNLYNHWIIWTTSFGIVCNYSLAVILSEITPMMLLPPIGWHLFAIAILTSGVIAWQPQTDKTNQHRTPQNHIGPPTLPATQGQSMPMRRTSAGNKPSMRLVQ